MGSIKTVPHVFSFIRANPERRDLLGGKGANLAAMIQADLPVPPGFTITTTACNEFLALGGRFPDGLEEEIRTGVSELEQHIGRTFGSSENPLLVSVRSGAAVSMPGMMDTILNLGLHRESIQGLASATDNPRFAWDAGRRLVQMYGNVVHAIRGEVFEEILDEIREREAVAHESDLRWEALQEACIRFLRIYRGEAGADFPEDPMEQLLGSIRAVFQSWNIPRAVTYRRLHGISDDLGTAVNIQAMVFGNLGSDSGTGVGFTRDPSNGEPAMYGEFLVNAQGEDVVAGIRTPQPIAELEGVFPAVYRELSELSGRLERHFRDVQDFEFTIEKEKLYLLQTRNGKRTAAAAVRIACDMVDEGLLTEAEALTRIDAAAISHLLHPQLDPNTELTAIGTGLPASPGAGSGIAVFDPDRAVDFAAKGHPVVMVRRETSPDDIHGVAVSQAVVTARGGMTSHAAVVTRAMGKACVAGVGSLEIRGDAGTCRFGEVEIAEGTWITIDGTEGRVLEGKVATIEPEFSAEFLRVLEWADRFRELKVRANADTPEEATRAREWGAEGIGLCRTEHMFMQDTRLPIVRRMIMAADASAREEALVELLPFQRSDFVAIFEAMDGLPVTIRLLDPPLHEFLPDRVELAREQERLIASGDDPDRLETVEALLDRVEDLHEANPMMGLRGCRLGLVFPEIYRMQIHAIFEAAVLARKDGIAVHPEIMIPLVGEVEELRRTRSQLESEAKQILESADVEIPYLFGTMIEIPRAALTAEAIAKEAEFFSFGTNDLTQMTYGYSRDDAEAAFLQHYLENGILKSNPFQTLDQEGVGALIRMTVEKGRTARPGMKIGICGEQGGDPASVHFLHGIGLDYVSCSPFRVPVARVAAAQAALRDM